MVTKLLRSEQTVSMPEHTRTSAQRAYTNSGERYDIGTFIKDTVSEAKGYLQAEKALFRIRVAEKTGVFLSKALYQITLFVCLAFMLLFLNLALGLYLGEVLHSRALGFVLVGVLYLIIFGLFHWYWKSGGDERFLLDRINDLDNED